MRLTRMLKGGLQFENLFLKPRGIIVFTTSPFEQNILKGQVVSRFPNAGRRLRDKLFIVIPMIGAYYLYDWMLNEHIRLQRKNPADYANDE